MNNTNKKELSEQQHAAILEEYKTLRAEIDHNSKVVLNVFLSNVIVTASLIGYGLKEDVGAIFFGPFAILIPSLFFISSQMESTTRISSYLRAFIEPVCGLNWQTRWYELRKSGFLPRKRKYASSITKLYWSLYFTCSLLALVFWDKRAIWSYFLFVLPITIYFWYAVKSVSESFSKSFRDGYSEAWEKLKKKN